MIKLPAARALIVVAAALPLSACEIGVMHPQGPIGAANRTILIDSVVIMLAIVLPTIAAILAFAWWYRASNPRARRLPDFVYSGQIEMVVWAIPALVVMLLAGVAWIGSHELDPAVRLPSDKPPLKVQVVSLDWKWLFIYPEQNIAAVNTLTVPVGRPVQFELTSASVMSAFFIPQLGSMIYTMNGMRTQLNLQADAAGTYHGLSAHFNGDGFADMNFQTHAVPDAAFSGFIDEARRSDSVLDANSYTELARQSSAVPPKLYRLGDANLFQSVVTLKLPPGPGPHMQPGMAKEAGIKVGKEVAREVAKEAAKEAAMGAHDVR